jgi:ferritin-like metal-binding protein YciE
MDRQDILNGYATDMHAVEKHILEAIERQYSDADVKKYPEANRLIGEIKATMQRHIAALEPYIEAKDGDIKDAVKGAAFKALGVAAGFWDQIRQQDQVSRMIRDDYTALSFAAVCYHMLHTTALGLKDQRLADLAGNHLKDLTPLIVDASKTICLVVAHELSDEDKSIDGAVGQQAVKNTQEAWSSQYVATA